MPRLRTASLWERPRWRWYKCSTAEGEDRFGGEEIEASLSPVAEPAGQIVEAQEIGDVVLTALGAVGHGSGSALPFEDRVWHASQWRSSKCVWWRVFNTQAEALEAAELRQ